MEEHRYLQVLGSVFLTLFAVGLFAVRYVRRLTPVWKDALMLAGLYNLVALIVRICSYLDLVSQLEGRVLNGLIASVFVASLITSIIGELIQGKIVEKSSNLS